MASRHLFFCSEIHCSAEAHVYGGRCDDCFELYIESLRAKHVCNGDMDYERGHKICDYREDPCCPQHVSPSCETCGCAAEFRDGERVCWCDLCQRTGCYYKSVSRKVCADCGKKPEDGYFLCYRGDEPLCAECEEAAYGPRSPIDWRKTYQS